MAFNDEVRNLANELETLLCNKPFSERTEAQQVLVLALDDFFMAAE